MRRAWDKLGGTALEQQNDRIPDQTVFVGFDASRLLLSLETGDRLVARRLGRRDRPCLLLHSCDADLFCAEAARPALSLDVCYVWRIHLRLRDHPRDGDLDTLARHLPAGRHDQGCYSRSVTGDGGVFDTAGSPSPSSSQPCAIAGRQPGARGRNQRATSGGGGVTEGATSWS